MFYPASAFRGLIVLPCLSIQRVNCFTLPLQKTTLCSSLEGFLMTSSRSTTTSRCARCRPSRLPSVALIPSWHASDQTQTLIGECELFYFRCNKITYTSSLVIILHTVFVLCTSTCSEAHFFSKKSDQNRLHIYPSYNGVTL